MLNESYDEARVFFVDTGKIPPDVFNTIAYVDPTVEKKYLHKMCVWYVENQANVEELKDFLERFNQLLGRGEIKDADISRFNTFAEFQQEVKNSEISKLKSKSIYEYPGKFPNDFNR